MKTKMLKKQARIQSLSDVPTSELIEELWGRSDVIGAQIWRTEDVVIAFEERGIQNPDPALVKAASTTARKDLENCEQGWAVLESAVESAISSCLSDARTEMNRENEDEEK